MRPQRALAATYLGDGWARTLCGPLVEPGPTSAGLVDLIVSGAAAQLDTLREALSAQAVARVDAALDALRSGDRAAVRALVDELRAETTWPTLAAGAQARVLRLAASLALRDRDLGEARTLASMADALHPPDEPRIATHIALEADGVDAALAVLGTPVTIAGSQLHAALLVMADRVGEAEAVLPALLAQSGDDPETLRAAALVALAAGDRALALERITAAEARAPRWTAVLQLGGIIRYAAALSPAVPSDWVLSPVAFDRALVREDRAALQSLAEAVTLFDALIAAEPDVDHHRIFRFAVLTSLCGERGRAEAEARDLLARTGADPTVVAFCLVRGVDVAFDEAEALLAAAYRDGADSMRVRALGMLLRAREAGEAGCALLAEGLAAQCPESRGEATRWMRQLGDDAVAVAFDAADDPIAARLDAARDAEDWNALGVILGELAETEQPEPLVLTVAEMLAAGGAWSVLAPHIDLILGFATAAAVRLAIHVAVRSDDADRAIVIIDAHAGAFGEALPADVRRLRAEALATRGELGQALREVDGVAAVSGLPRDRMLRAELRASAGDLRSTIPALREAFDAGILSGDRAYQWSRLIRHEEPRLARDLLGHAICGQLDDRLIVAAMHDAMTLAPDLDIRELMGRVHSRAAGNAPDIRLLTIDDIPALLAEQQANAEETEAMYLDGALPAHLFYRHAPAAFAHLYAGSAATPDGAPRPWPIRHGARPASVIYPTPYDEWRIHLDISALLIADRLGLLDTLEAHPNGLRLSPRMPLLLVGLENALRSEASTLLVDRIDAATPAVAGIADEGAVRVAAVGSPTDLSLRALAAALAARGAIGADAVSRLVAGLPDVQPGESDVAVPPDGTPLRLDAVALHQLASADLLGAVTARHPLSAPGRVLDQAAAARVSAEDAAAVADRLAGIRVRVATGIETGVYRLLPPSAPDDPDDAHDDALLSLVYRDLIAASGGPGDMAWIDDRLTTGYATTASMPVVGVADVMAAMVDAGRLSSEASRRLTAELRRGGALFMPPSADELTDALRAAAIVDGHIVETDALRELRRSIAHHGRHERRLKIGDAVSETAAALDAIVPIQRTMRLMSDALTAVWTEAGQSDEARIARSDWLWANTRATHVGRRIPGPDPHAGQSLFETMQIGHCLDQAIEVGGLRDQRRGDRMQYLGWLWHRAIEPLLRVDPNFLTRLGRYLADFYAGLLGGALARDPKSTRVLKQLLARRIHSLPEPIQAELYRDRRLSMFGTLQERVTIGRVQLEPARFWRAVRIAGRYGEAHLPLRRRGHRMRRVRVRRDGSGILLTGAVRARIGDDIVAIVIARAADRPAAIAAFIAALQLDPQAAAAAIHAAHIATDDAALVSALRDAREGSAAARYADIDQRLRRRERFRLDLLAPPPFAAIAAALAIPVDATDLPAVVTAARRKLVERAGAAHVLRALAGVPAMLDWEEGADAATIAACDANARTPLTLIHVAEAAQRRGAPADHVAALVERLLAAIVDAGPLFLALLRWTWRLAARDAAWRAAPPPLGMALIWAHANRVLAALLDGQIERSRLLEMIEESQPDLAGVDIIRFVAAASGDAAWPAGMSSAALLYHGLGHIFGGADAAAALGNELTERLAVAMSGTLAGVTGPEAKLLGRDPAGPDMLGSFLRAAPRGIMDGDAAPAVIRERLVTGALAVLVADPNDAGAWAQFGGFAALSGVDTDNVDRLEAALGEDGVRLAGLAADGNYAIWRAVLGPLAARDPDRAAARAGMLADACRWLEEAPPTSCAFRPDRATAASELVEVAALIAARTPGAEADRFATLVERVAIGWPAIAGDLRAMADGITTRTPSSRADALWRMLLALRVRP